MQFVSQETLLFVGHKYFIRKSFFVKFTKLFAGITFESKKKRIMRGGKWVAVKVREPATKHCKAVVRAYLTEEVPSLTERINYYEKHKNACAALRHRVLTG